MAWSRPTPAFGVCPGTLTNASEAGVVNSPGFKWAMQPATTPPNNYTSGVLVQSRGYSPFQCSGCEGAHKDFDDNNKSVQFGSGAPVVRLSTVNGPVSINEDMD